MQLSSHFARLFASAALTCCLVGTPGCASTNPPTTDSKDPIATGALPDVGCDYTTALKKSCAISGCHVTRTGVPPISALDLTPDATFRQRVVDVVAGHADIDCTMNGVYMPCVPPPAACPAGVKIVDRSNPEASWVLKKLDGSTTGCGDTMPMPPGDSMTTGWSPDTKACLETFFRALAANK